MSERFSLEDAEATAVASLEEPVGLVEPDTPFRVLLLGDWSGRASRGGAAASGGTRRPVMIDRDNFDQVLAKMDVALHLALAGENAPRLALRFNQLDDFHPDRIFEQVEIFDSLKDTRERLGHYSTFDDAAEEVRRWTRKTPASQAASPSSATEENAPASQPASSPTVSPQMSGCFPVMRARRARLRPHHRVQLRPTPLTGIRSWATSCARTLRRAKTPTRMISSRRLTKRPAA